MFARKWAALLLVCFGLGFIVSLPAHAEDTKEVTEFANNLGNQAIAIITNKSLAEDARRTQLEALFVKNVDIDWIGKFVLGRYFRDTTDDQKKQYLTNYRTFLIKHYTSNLTEFTDANFEVIKVAPAETGGDTVTMRLKRPNAEDTIVDYTVRKEDDGSLKVYDIIVEGVSMITTQRSEFGSVVSQKGMDYLIAQLAERSKTEAAKQ
jgi:phospholipid transport system substrate-binding protein